MSLNHILCMFQVRPYARKVSGIPVKMNFDLYHRVFTLLVVSVQSQHPTEVFVPLLHYPAGIKVSVSSGHWDHQEEAQVLLWWHGSDSAAESEHFITISDTRTI